MKSIRQGLFRDKDKDKEKDKDVVSPRGKSAAGPSSGGTPLHIAMGNLSIDSLDSTLLGNVFRYLPPRDLFNAALTCKRWHETFKIFAAPKKRELMGVQFFTTEEITALTTNPLKSSKDSHDGTNSLSASKLVSNHKFKDKTLTSPTFCTICTKFIWGTFPTAVHCKVCDAFIHKKCFKEEFTHGPCPFPQTRATTPDGGEFCWKITLRNVNLCRLAYLTESELKAQAQDNNIQVLHFINEKKYDTQGFIAVDESRQQVILSFTGTVSIKDIWTDVCCTLVQFPELKHKGTGFFVADMIKKKKNKGHGHTDDAEFDQKVKGCEVHSGFARSYLSVAEQIVTNLAAAYSKYPTYELQITGHSLGGALATLAAVDLKFKINPPRINVFTVGQPRVGTRPFVKLYESVVDVSWRMVNFGDAVPTLPPPNPLLPYKHTSHQILYGRREKAAGYALNPFGLTNEVAKEREKKRWKQAKELNSLTTHTIYMGVAFPSRPQLVFNKATN